jgi:hypothetical protein
MAKASPALPGLALAAAGAAACSAQYSAGRTKSNTIITSTSIAAVFCFIALPLFTSTQKKRSYFLACPEHHL